MENAVKALLIAAAVLIAILLISMVMNVFNMGSEQVEGAGDLSEYEIQQFNNKFKAYEGTSETGSRVNALLETVFNHNNSQEDTSTCVQVTVQLKSGTNSGVAKSNQLTSSPTKVATGSRYGVVLTFDSNTKLVSSIAITEVGATTPTTPPEE